MNWSLAVAAGALGVFVTLLLAILLGAWAEKHGTPPAPSPRIEPDYEDGRP